MVNGEVDVPITLVVADDVAFTPGTSLTGDIADPGDTDSASFVAVKGEKLVVKTTAIAPGLKLLVDLIDDQGTTLDTFKLKEAGDKGKVTFDETRVVRLVVSSKNGATGAYELETKRKAPDAAESMRREKGKPGSPGGDVEIPVTSFGGTGSVDITVTPAKDDVGPFGVEWIDPAGTPRAASELSESLPTGGLQLVDVPFSAPGESTLRITGFSSTEKVFVHLNATPPADPADTLAID